MVDCKDALAQSIDGGGAINMEAALEFLKKKGMGVASKRAGNAANEGLIAVASNSAGNRVALVEINTETDFVARNERFRKLCFDIGAAVLAAPINANDVTGDVLSVSSVLAAKAHNGASVETLIFEAVTALKENIQVRRAVRLDCPEGGIVSSYAHNLVDSVTVADATVKLGTQGSLLALTAGDAVTMDSSLSTLAYRLAMHVVAAKPQFLSRLHVPDSVIESERKLLVEQLQAPGAKPVPADKLQKVVDGRLSKFYQQRVLLDQTYLIGAMDAGDAKECTVGEVLAKQGKAKMQGFHRLALGEE